MARLVICDRCDAEDNDTDAQATKAVAHVSATKKDGNVVSTLASEDACVVHIAGAVESLWARKHRDPLFYEIVVVKVPSD